MADKVEDRTKVLPAGRLINHHLWDKSVYADPKGKEGTPKYTIEIAYDEETRDEIEESFGAYVENKWGDDALANFAEGEDYLSPFKDGDKMAKAREKKGKTGDAYKGMFILRAGTIYNIDGDDAPGGIAVFDEDAEPIEFIDKQARRAVYSGCMMAMGIVIDDYDDNGTTKLMLYLKAVQKTDDGERLSTGTDYSGMFQKTGRTKGKSKRRTRKTG